MNFETIRDNLIVLLGANENGRFTTIGYKQRANSALLNRDNLRTVQVVYNRGDFPQSSASLDGPYQHDIKFDLILMASSASKTDLNVIENPSSTPAEIAQAILDTQSAEFLANRSLDELFGVVFEILMSASNIDVGSDFKIANRWITEFSKADFLRRGKYVFVTGMVSFMCRIDEDAPGDDYIGVLEIIDTSFDFPGDAIQRSGVKIEGTYVIDEETNAYLVDQLGNLIIDGEE